MLLWKRLLMHWLQEDESEKFWNESLSPTPLACDFMFQSYWPLFNSWTCQQPGFTYLVSSCYQGSLGLPLLQRVLLSPLYLKFLFPTLLSLTSPHLLPSWPFSQNVLLIYAFVYCVSSRCTLHEGRDCLVHRCLPSA